MKDKDYWAQLHIKSDRSPAIEIKPEPKVNRFMRGDGVRRFRGGFLNEAQL